MNFIDQINADAKRVEDEAKAVLAKQTAAVTAHVERAISKTAGQEVAHVEHLVTKESDKVENTVANVVSETLATKTANVVATPVVANSDVVATTEANSSAS